MHLPFCCQGGHSTFIVLQLFLYESAEPESAWAAELKEALNVLVCTGQTMFNFPCLGVMNLAEDVVRDELRVAADHLLAEPHELGDRAELLAELHGREGQVKLD